MIDFSPLEVWFLTGSQHLYGPETLAQVEADSRQVVEALNGEAGLPVKLVFKPVLKTPEEIAGRCATPTPHRIASASSPGCIPSARPRCGSPG